MKILKDNLDKLHVMADALIKYETIDSDQIDDIMAGAKPREPKIGMNHQPKMQRRNLKSHLLKGQLKKHSFLT